MFHKDDFTDYCITKSGIKLGTAKTYVSKLKKVCLMLDRYGWGSLDTALFEHSSDEVLNWAKEQKFYENSGTNRDATSALTKYIEFFRY